MNGIEQRMNDWVENWSSIFRVGNSCHWGHKKKKRINKKSIKSTWPFFIHFVFIANRLVLFSSFVYVISVQCGTSSKKPQNRWPIKSHLPLLRERESKRGEQKRNESTTTRFFFREYVFLRCTLLSFVCLYSFRIFDWVEKTKMVESALSIASHSIDKVFWDFK